MIVYISGKITGDDLYRYKFADAETVLTNLGYTVLNPAKLPDGMEYEQYMMIGMAMVGAADMVVMLPDWRRSKGAKMERRRAIESGKPIEDYESLIRKRLNELEETLNAE